ncbi:hypothetical protein BCR34DRAFT_488260 [Clohesyomyces aquaticus]|uniref:Zn(2)-C6 fungal-type domain-containing protein n=1 Tax=Clohesyomyces aquaticus TaxID=1231657 RepID=A0A1Y1ZFQ9_9PLEO|nr:hypothetical protein BCR34DRAFT_488260 [Clohesyomyces aquaticus]
MSLSLHASTVRIFEPNRTKRRRLNSACNYCRTRKTRCDEQKPSCHACLAAGLPCITTDPKRSERHIERREAGKRSGHTKPHSILDHTPGNKDSQGQGEIGGPPGTAVSP